MVVIKTGKDAWVDKDLVENSIRIDNAGATLNRFGVVITSIVLAYGHL